MPNIVRPFIPILFVLLWSTGFIFSRYSMEGGAQPASFLTIRFGIATAFLVILCLAFPSLRKVSITWRQIAHAAIAGILLQAVYLGGVFAGINLGIGAGLSSLIVGIQPVLTVILAAFWLSEKLSWSKLLGITMGFMGAALVGAAWNDTTSAIPLNGVLFCIAALLGITLGTLYQKRFCQSIDLHINIIIQYIASFCFLLPFGIAFESYDIDWTFRLVASMAWLAIVLSIGAVFLLMWLINVGEAGRVSSLFFLVPPVVAIEAWLLFDEPLTPRVIFGTFLCVLGVAIVSGVLAKLNPRTGLEAKK